MSEQIDKEKIKQRPNKLKEKFDQVEGLVGLFSEDEKNIQFGDPAFSKQSLEAHVEEEVVLWKKKNTSFRSKSSTINVLGENLASNWANFTNGLRFIAPDNINISFVQRPKNTDGMGKLFSFVLKVFKNNPDFFKLSTANNITGNIESNEEKGIFQAIFGLEIPVINPRSSAEEIKRLHSKKLSILRALYQIKCREENDEIKIQLHHNKNTLEASDLVALCFVDQGVDAKVDVETEPMQIAKSTDSPIVPTSRIRKKLNTELDM